MAVSGPKPGILRECQFRFQIGDTPRRSETLVIHGLQRFTPQFNRTAVIKNTISKSQLFQAVFESITLTAKPESPLRGDYSRSPDSG
jgi:peptide subunit release factor RF-3